MIGVYKYDERAKIPTRNTPGDAGLDLFAMEDVFIPLGTTVKIDLGLAIEIPPSCVGKIEDRSSLGAKGLKVSGGVVDAGYTGRLSVILNNLTFNQHNGWVYDKLQPGYQIKAGDRIAQLLIYKVENYQPCQVISLWDSERGDKGFGSSGR